MGAGTKGLQSAGGKSVRKLLGTCCVSRGSADRTPHAMEVSNQGGSSPLQSH